MLFLHSTLHLSQDDDGKAKPLHSTKMIHVQHTGCVGDDDGWWWIFVLCGGGGVCAMCRSLRNGTSN